MLKKEMPLFMAGRYASILAIFFSLPTVCTLASLTMETGVEDVSSAERPLRNAGRDAPLEMMPDEYEDVIREYNDLYTRLVSLLNSVDSHERYQAIRDSIKGVVREIATLRSRHPDLDPKALSNRLVGDREFLRLNTAFDAERTRLRDQLPDVSRLLVKLMMESVPVDMNQEAQVAFEEMMELYEDIVRALEAIRTPEEGENSSDTLRSLALRLKATEAKYSGMKDWFQLMMEEDPRARDLSERLDASFARLFADPGMESVFKALEPLASESSELDRPTPEEQSALENYGLALEKAVDLLRQIKTPEDIERLAEELLALTELDREFNERLPGKRGELLIESDPELAKLLQEMGVEQMRIEDDPDLNAGMEVLFGEGRE